MPRNCVTTNQDSVSSYQDTFSTRPSHRYSHAAPKTMSHSCDCNVTTYVRHGYHVQSFCGVCTEYWALHCFPGAGASGYGYRSIFRLVYQWEFVGCCPRVCMVWPGQLPKGKFTWFLFFVTVVVLSAWVACYSCVQVRTGQSGRRRAGRTPPKITPKKTKIHAVPRHWHADMPNFDCRAFAKHVQNVFRSLRCFLDVSTCTRIDLGLKKCSPPSTLSPSSLLSDTLEFCRASHSAMLARTHNAKQKTQTMKQQHNCCPHHLSVLLLFFL